MESKIERVCADPYSIVYLTPIDRIAVLELLFGPRDDFVYTSEEWLDSKYRCVTYNTIEAWKSNEEDTISAKHMLICSALTWHLFRGDWAIAGMLMMFLKIGYHRFNRFTHDTAENWLNFTKVFPCGCFRKCLAEVQATPNNIDDVAVMQWCFGITKRALLDITFKWADATILNGVLFGISHCEYTGLEIYEFYWQLATSWSDAFMRGRILEINKAFRNKRLLPRGQQTDSIVYPCLVPFHHWLVEYVEGELEIPFKVSRPIWSRHSHRYLTDSKFKQVALTVLLMQKFRYAQFSLHRDLIDMVLEYVFAGEIDAMEAAMIAKTGKMRHFMAKPKEYRDKFCLQQGIVSNVHSCGYGDAMDLAEGIPIHQDRMNNYNKTMENRITWTTCLLKFCQSMAACMKAEDSEFVGKWILQHCRDMKYDLSEIMAGKRVLNGDDLRIIIKKHYPHWYGDV